MVLESEGSTVGLKVTSKRTYAIVCLPGLLLPMPLSPEQGLSTHASTGDPQTEPDVSVGVYFGSLLFSPRSWCAYGFVSLLQESLFPPVLCKFFNQIPLNFKVKKDVLFITGDWNTKVESQDKPGVTGKFGLGVRNETRQRLTEFCQDNALVPANTLFQQHKRRLYTWTSPDGQYWNQI